MNGIHIGEELVNQQLDQARMRASDWPESLHQQIQQRLVGLSLTKLELSPTWLYQQDQKSEDPKLYLKKKLCLGAT